MTNVFIAAKSSRLSYQRKLFSHGSTQRAEKSRHINVRLKFERTTVLSILAGFGWLVAHSSVTTWLAVWLPVRAKTRFNEKNGRVLLKTSNCGSARSTIGRVLL